MLLLVHLEHFVGWCCREMCELNARAKIVLQKGVFEMQSVNVFGGGVPSSLFSLGCFTFSCFVCNVA